MEPISTNWNIFEFFESFFSTLITYANTLWTWLSADITIGGVTIKLITVLGGAVITTLILWRIIKEFV